MKHEPAMAAGVRFCRVSENPALAGQAACLPMARSTQEPIAIIGIGCRFPGGATSADAFWKLMCAGTDAISEIPPDRWSIRSHYDPVPGRPGKSISKWGGFIENI